MHYIYPSYDINPSLQLQEFARGFNILLVWVSSIHDRQF